MCRWRTIDDGRETRGEEAFRLNNRPNPNQNKTEFCAKLLFHLAWRNEAVIFSPGGRDLFVADSWSIDHKGTSDDIYRDVAVEYSKQTWTFLSRDVMHLRLNWVGLYPLLSSIADEYEAMITTAYTGYKNRPAAKA